jgi:hypothetical protein
MQQGWNPFQPIWQEKSQTAFFGSLGIKAETQLTAFKFLGADLP